MEASLVFDEKCETDYCDCDFCGETYPRSALCVSEDFTHLCPDCKTYYESMSDILKERIGSFLEGNVC